MMSVEANMESDIKRIIKVKITLNQALPIDKIDNQFQMIGNQWIGYQLIPIIDR